MSDLDPTPHMHEIFVKMRDLLSDPKKWTKRHYALTATNRGVASDDPDAVCWCVLGALRKVGSEARASIAASKLKRFLPDEAKVNRLALDEFNDANSTKHADIIALLDRAIEGTK